MKNINLEELAGLLKQGLEGKVRLSADITMYQKALSKLNLRYRGEASLHNYAANNKVLVLNVGEISLDFQPHKVEYQKPTSDHDCGGVKHYPEYMTIDVGHDMAIRIEEAKEIEY